MTRLPPSVPLEDISGPPCERCRVYTPETFLERAGDGSLVCPGCLSADEDEDDRDDHDACVCRSYCNACTPGVERWI